MADFARVLRDELDCIDRRRHALVDETNCEPKAQGPRSPRNGEDHARGAKVSATVVPVCTTSGTVDDTDGDDHAQSAVMAERLRALDMHVAGLAISGGGIRSATFALGVLQALAHFKLLRRFDYLSTVSGGGYIGSWLSAWIEREQSIANVEQQLAPSRVDQSEAHRRLLPKSMVVDEEPETIQHLRAYSDYLTPRLGVLTPDTWTILAIYFRNILINLLMLLPATVGLLLAARFLVVLTYVQAVSSDAEDASGIVVSAVIGIAVAFGLLVRAFWNNSVALAELRQMGSNGTEPTERPTSAPDPSPKSGSEPMNEVRLVRGVVLPIVFASVLIVWDFLQLNQLRDFYRQWYPEVDGDVVSAWTATTWWIVGPFTFLTGLVTIVLHRITHRGYGGPDRAKLGKAAVLSGLLGGSLFSLLFVWILFVAGTGDLSCGPTIAIYGPPLALVVVVVAFLAEVAVLGRVIGEAEREWWARLSAWLLMSAVAWASFFGCFLLVPALLIWFDSRFINTGILAGWIVTTVGGLMAGRSPRTKDGNGTPWLEWLGVVAPHVFLAGLFTGVSLLVDFLVNDPRPRFDGPATRDLLEIYWKGIAGAGGSTIFLWMAGSVGFAWVMTRFVDVNLFSLNNMYANRLIRCYLGASRPKANWRKRWVDGTWVPGGGGAPTNSQGPDRQQNRVTGFDPKDDIPLTDLVNNPADAAGDGDDPNAPANPDQHAYEGPYHIINTSLNLVAGKELAWRDRKAESFVMTPRYCGSDATGYAPMTPAAAEKLTLGRAVAISGAAVDPNMSFHQSPSLTALMTIFNARLGWWLQNPSKPNWNGDGPSCSLLLYSELFGWTDDLGDYVHLSDGGHFENLGIYELVRRRCRYIVAVEAPADPSAATDSLANMIRLCRIDFGVRIDLDTNPLERTGTQSLSQWHCAIGIIHYEDVDGGELPGILVYIRASLTGDEPPDVQEYAAKNPAFPFQSTLDQFFNETQFESYRALGYHAATHVFKDALRDIGVLFPDRAVFDTDEAFIQENRALFAELRRRWFPPIPDPDRAIDQASKDWLEVQKQFSDKPALKDLAAELVPELGSFLRPAKVAKGDLGANNGKGYGAEPEETHPDHREIVELATVGQMLQVMENAWIALKMETRSDHPMNRGWMNVFRRWTGSDTFQQLWPFFRGQFNRDFIDFCEDQLRLQSGQTRHVRTVDLAADVRERAIAFLVHAFDREWPSDPSRSADGKATPRWIKSGLGGLIEDAGRLGLASPAAWLITQDIAIPRSCREQFPCGIVLARNDSFTAGMYELFVWILPAYRGLGIGRRHLGAILKSLTRELVERASGEPVSYHVRFPSSGFERDVKETLWLSFFYHYDFRPADRHKHRPGDDLLLKAHFTYNELADRLQSRRSR